MTKIKVIIAILSLLVIGLATSLTIVSVKYSNSVNNTQESNKKEDDSTPTDQGTGEAQSSIEDEYFTITFNNFDGTKLDEISVKKGDIPSYTKQIPQKDNTNNAVYTFTGWNPEIKAASENKTYTATFAQNDLYIVTFDSNNVAK